MKGPLWVIICVWYYLIKLKWEWRMPSPSLPQKNIYEYINMQIRFTARCLLLHNKSIFSERRHKFAHHSCVSCILDCSWSSASFQSSETSVTAAVRLYFNLHFHLAVLLIGSYPHFHWDKVWAISADNLSLLKASQSDYCMWLCSFITRNKHKLRPFKVKLQDY